MGNCQYAQCVVQAWNSLFYCCELDAADAGSPSSEEGEWVFISYSHCSAGLGGALFEGLGVLQPAFDFGPRANPGN